MNKIDHGGPAFPLANGTENNMGEMNRAGMTLRDYFAIHAPEPNKESVDLYRQGDRQRNPHNDSFKPKLRSSAEIIAQLRYEYADAMLKEREKQS